MNEAHGWEDYQIVASGGGEKLEKWGDFYLLRPDPQAIWNTPFDLSKFRMLHGRYLRSTKGGGKWEFYKTLPKEWTVTYNNLKFLISPTGFKHTGLFPEQAYNWERIQGLCQKKTSGKLKVLNLFGYTGAATVAAAITGAHVTHVDSSRGMTEICRRNVALNNIPKESVRFIVEDCLKFVQRELRRGNTYDAIIMDPPSFGRGTGGEVWKLETHIDPLVAECCKLLSKNPAFFLLNSYTTGLQPTVMKNILQTNLAKLFPAGDGKERKTSAHLEAYELGLPTLEGFTLPAGCSAIAIFSKENKGGEK